MKYKGKMMRTNIICYMLIISIIAGLFVYFDLGSVYAYEEKKGIVQVDDVLNVRTGPGTSYSKLTHSGSNVRLTNGTALDIIGEQYATDGAKWYQIRFVYQNTTLEGYVHSNYVYVQDEIEYSPDADFEEYLTQQGFPESYKEGLRKLHAKYPKWVFLADHIDYEWDEVVTNEASSGRSLISMSSISSWKSTNTDAYNWNTGTWYGFDGGSWAVASKELVAYALDPRNFLDEKYIFQFESLSFQPECQTLTGLNSLIAGTFLGTNSITNDTTGGTMSYAEALMAAAAASGVSPFCLASSIIQEQGTAGTSKNISGTVSGYVGYYNYFNWGAYASGGNSAVINGLIYAKATDEYSLRPWNTRYKSIVGGAKLLGKSYINIGQDTVYYKKFDFVGTPYTHQYMTHIIAARNEGLIASNGYSESMKAEMAMVFKIPVFKNMPENVCGIPTKTGSPNNCLKSLSIAEGKTTQTFDKFTETYDLTVENNVTSVNVSAQAIDSKAVVTGTGNSSLNVGNNEIQIKVTAENGDVRIYKIYVNRKKGTSTDSGNNETPDNPETPSGDGGNNSEVVPPKTSYKVSNVKLDETKNLVSGVSEKTTVDVFVKYFTVTNGSCKVLTSKKRGKTGNVFTGDIVQILDSKGTVIKEFTILVKGDVNGDGVITVKDAFGIKRQILGEAGLVGVYKSAADVNGDGTVSVKDAFQIKRHILGEEKIK